MIEKTKNTKRIVKFGIPRSKTKEGLYRVPIPLPNPTWIRITSEEKLQVKKRLILILFGVELQVKKSP